MELFETTISSIRDFLETLGSRRVFSGDSSVPWPSGKGRNIVLKDDMGLELGNPDRGSLSSLLWTEDVSKISDGRITLVGPDFPESTGRSLPLGKLVLAAVEGFDEENAYDRHKDMEFLRYELDLKGFMMRAVSQYQREWCRISREALLRGFSVSTLGSALLKLFLGKPYVTAAEVIFITSGAEDVDRLREFTAPAERIIAAMNKMAGEFDFDCSSCDYRDVCEEADGLKDMRQKLRDRTREEASVAEVNLQNGHSWAKQKGERI